MMAGWDVEAEVRLAEKRSDHARGVEDLQAWQARLDAYLSRHDD